jgi:DUF4097 and DUF4098 domain-containing protein YvlB
MRRSSLVAPLLLICIGALFLARNLYPELPLMDYLGRYWPFLLIVWGALRLAEVLFWAATEKPLPARGLSPGEWIVVVLVCLFGFSLHTVQSVSNWWPQHGITMGGIDMFGESFEYPLSAEKSSTKTPRVVIESFRGNARIIGVDEGEAVKVTGRKVVRSMDQNGADRANQDAPLELAGDANQIIVRTNQDRASGSQRVSAEMEITVPRGSTIEAHGRAGDFDLNGINGNVEITSDNAGVRLENVGGEVRVDLRRSDIVRAVNVKGGLELKGRGSDVDLENVGGQVIIEGTYTGTLQFKNLSKPLRFTGPQTELAIEKLPGEARLALGQFTASNLAGPVRISTRSRDVELNDFTNSLEISQERGDIELRPGKAPLGKMDVHTRSGNIELSLPATAKFDLTASTSRGEVVNDFGPPLKLESESRRGATLRGSTGSGPTVSLQTDRGQITVRKASADESNPPATPVPPQPPKQLKKIEQ